MTGQSQRQVGALLCAVLLVAVGPISAGPVTGITATGSQTGQAALTTAGNQQATTSSEATLSTCRDNGTTLPKLTDACPGDPDGDGRYEDVNGDGSVNLIDSQALYDDLNNSQVNISAFDFTRDGRTDVGDVWWLYATTTDTPVNDTDGDGLPNSYERQVTGTDPTDYDSNSTLTATNESGNGTIDGLEDFDGDGLATYREYNIRTDPLSNDTDGDGLGDKEELFEPTVSAVLNDTDGDGTLDGAEDFDGDNLTVAAELANGTAINDSDTDRDGLADGSELKQYGTDPLDYDTDGDGLSDGDEIAVGSDPLSNDTDGDGTVDANETYETTTTHNATNVTLSLRGEGNVADSIAISSKKSYFKTPRVPSGPRSVS